MSETCSQVSWHWAHLMPFMVFYPLEDPAMVRFLKTTVWKKVNWDESWWDEIVKMSCSISLNASFKFWTGKCNWTLKQGKQRKSRQLTIQILLLWQGCFMAKTKQRLFRAVPEHTPRSTQAHMHPPPWFYFPFIILPIMAQGMTHQNCRIQRWIYQNSELDNKLLALFLFINDSWGKSPWLAGQIPTCS